MRVAPNSCRPIAASFLFFGGCVLVAGCTHRAVVVSDDGGPVSERPALDRALPPDAPSDGAGDDGAPPDGPLADHRRPDRWPFDAPRPDAPRPDVSHTDGNHDATDYIYLVDSSSHLLRFNPITLAITPIATLACPGTSSKPFSMGVDQTARGWVLYQDGILFWVNLKTGACTKCPFQPTTVGFQYYGMGFVSNSPTTHDERLYIAESPSWSGNPLSRLASIEPTTFGFQIHGELLPGDPELTGTGAAELFAYYPSTTSSYIAKHDKTTAAAIQTWALPSLPSSPSGWAFAHWGGRFYLFVSPGSVPKVLMFNPKSGQLVTLVSGHPYNVVGAGVSARAPLVFPDGGAPD
jgi:hypothetical protein